MEDETIEKVGASGSAASPWSAYKAPDRKYLMIGGAFSLAYVLGFAVYGVMQLTTFLQMTPDEFAGFLSGVFAPLAFLWLVLGFMQQGEELRQSSHALWLQGEELRASVEQQRELVNVTREQLQFESEKVREQREEIERNSQPRLNVLPGGSYGSGADKRIYEFFLLNHGKACTGVKLFFDGVAGSSADSLPSGGRFQFNREFPNGSVAPFTLQVDYIDERLIHGSKSFEISKPEHTFLIKELREMLAG